MKNMVSRSSIHHCSEKMWTERVHPQGPIIRVSPEEIHISDPLFYYELFVGPGVRRTNAYYRYAQGTGFEGTSEIAPGAKGVNIDFWSLDIFAIISSHEGHKAIRGPFEALFSKISVHEPQTMACVRSLCDRLDEAKDTDEPINLSHACLSLAIGSVTPSHRHLKNTNRHFCLCRCCDLCGFRAPGGVSEGTFLQRSAVCDPWVSESVHTD